MKSAFKAVKTADIGRKKLAEYSVPVLLAVYIFAQPFHYLTAVEEAGIYLAFFVSVYLILAKKVEFAFDTPLSLPFLLFALWALVGIAFAINKPNSIHDFYAHLLKYYVLFFLVFNFFRTRERFLALALVITVSFTVFSLWGMVCVYGIEDKKLFVDRFTNPAFLPYRTYIHVFGAITAISFFYSETAASRKLFYALCISINVLATFLSQTRSAIIALMAALYLLLIVKRKYKQLVLITVVLLTAVYFSPVKARFMDEREYTVRIANYYLYSAIIRDYPITGIGFGMQTYQDPKLNIDSYNDYVPEKIRVSPPILSPHNTFLDIAARLGLIGFLGLYVFIIFASVKMLFVVIRIERTVSSQEWGFCLCANFLACFIQAMFTETSFGVQALTQCLLFAMIAILWKIGKDGREDMMSKREK
jgi:O-antigen ligase